MDLTNRRFHILLLIFVIGAGLRFAGIGWGLPLLLHPDEGVVTQPAHKLAQNHSFETKVYHRPNHISIKVNSILYAIVNAYYLNAPIEKSVADNPIFYLTSRAFVAFLGLGCIILAYFIGAKLNPSIGVLAAGLCAFFPSFVEHSHYITPDIPLTFFTMCVTLYAFKYLEFKSYSNLMLMVLFAAIATCEKYPGAFSCLVIAYVVILNNIKDPRTLIIHALLVFFLYLAAIFIISPVLFIDFKHVYEAVKIEGRTGHLGADGFGFCGNLLFYLQCYLKNSQIIIFISYIIGIIYCIKVYKSKGFIIIVAFLFVLPLSSLGLHWERWMLPVYINMILLSSIGIYHTLLASIDNKIINKASKVALILAFISTLLSSLLVTIRFCTTDSRNVALEYCINNGIDKNNSIFEGYSPLNPGKPGTIFTFVKKVNNSLQIDNSNIKYIILSSYMYQRIYNEPITYKSFIELYEKLKELPIVKEFRPVAEIKSEIEIINIINVINSVYLFYDGGLSGPTIIIYKYGYN